MHRKNDGLAVAIEPILEKRLEHRHHRRFAESPRPREEDDLLRTRQKPRNHIGLVDVIAMFIHDFGKKSVPAMGYFRFSVIIVSPEPTAQGARTVL